MCTHIQCDSWVNFRSWLKDIIEEYIHEVGKKQLTFLQIRNSFHWTSIIFHNVANIKQLKNKYKKYF